MQVTVEIPDALVSEAKAHGLTPESYVRNLVNDAMQSVTAKAVKTPHDMDVFFEEMAACSDKIPQLPDEAFTRESFYQDHD